MTTSLFEVPLGKKQVSEQEPPSGLVHYTTKRKCSSACHLTPIFPVSVCNLELGWGLFYFCLRPQHLQKITFLGTSSICSPDFENNSWLQPQRISICCQAIALFTSVLGEELNFPSCLESRLLNNDRGLPPGLSVFVDSPWRSLVTFIKFNLSFPYQSHIIYFLSSQNFYKILIHWWFISCFPECHGVIHFNLSILLIQGDFERKKIQTDMSFQLSHFLSQLKL